MTHYGRPGRSGAIDARARARRIANLRSRGALAHMPERERQARLDWLAQLAGKVEARAFTSSELRDAEAALQHPESRQASMAFKGADRA